MNSRSRFLKILILIFAQFGAVTLVHARDYRLIWELPGKLAKIELECHKGWGSGNVPEGWDSGNTAAMQDATYHYNEGLLGLIKSLAFAYYPDKWISQAEIERYGTGLYAVHRFNEKAKNPSGEFKGTMSYLDVPTSVSTDLEVAICAMVKSISADDPQFDYKRWKYQWDRAERTGD